MNRHFQMELAYSLEERGNEMFDKFYFRVFPHLKSIELVKDINLQKLGIDKILIFESNKRIFIDEKKRRKDYGDILLEEYSDFDNKKIGWLSRSKFTDYIVYALMDTKKIYLLPFQLLQLAWISNYGKWLNEYGRKFSNNENYRTSNIPIPTEILLESIKQEMKK